MGMGDPTGGLLDDAAMEALKKFHDLRTRDLDVDWMYIPHIWNIHSGYPDWITNEDLVKLKNRLDKIKKVELK